MIQLHSDCLVFEVAGGDKIPCSVEKLTIEVLAESAEQVDPEVIRQAAAAVLHYFRDDLGRTSVTVAEFTAALEEVLTGLGFEVDSANAHLPSKPGSGGSEVVEINLAQMAEGQADGWELGFYARLRTTLKDVLSRTPRMVRVSGLRPCAKRLARVQRWCPRSVQISDDIVRFLRDCWGAEGARKECALLVR